MNKFAIGQFRAPAKRFALKGAGLAVLASPLAFLTQSAKAVATGVDVSTVTDTISAQSASVTTVGLAILAVIVGIVAFTWIRKAIH